MLAELGGEEGRLAANSLASAQVWLATILGPAIAGVLLSQVAPGWLLAFDAVSFAFLGLQAWRTHSVTSSDEPVDTHAAESGFRLLRRNDLLGLIALTWLFFFLYGPVEDALPVYVAHVGANANGMRHAPQPATIARTIVRVARRRSIPTSSVEVSAPIPKLVQ